MMILFTSFSLKRLESLVLVLALQENSETMKPNDVYFCCATNLTMLLASAVKS